ncbi:MAG: 2-oxo acid dehydrogenase subunit E2 [Alphaproteobacteria bacterium]|nr:2-oxo acid dehydrogenase subunit E2 [Alphaproteobacteria bacterium]
MGRFVFKLPDVGEGTAEAEIVAWHVAVGDTIKEDQHLVDVMTDKATVEMTSPVAGKVVEVHGEPGSMAPVGAPLVILEVEGAGNEKANGASKAARAAPPPVAAKAPEPPPAPKPIAKPSPAPAAKPEPVSTHQDHMPATRKFGDKPLASPAVRQRAQELGIRLQFVQGSGPAGRITHADLDAFIARGPNAPTPGGAQLIQREGEEEIKVIGLRRKIAEKMVESKRRIPHYAYVDEVDVTELEDLRANLNETKRPDQPKLTLLPFIMRALVRVLPDFPQINARFDDEVGIVHRFAPVHIGIATQTANGLIVPVVHHAEARDLWNAAAEIARVAQLTRDGKAGKDDLSGSTITITSLGALGGLVTTPVINHPEVAIIGPNAIVERPVVHNGHIAVRKMMNLSSSFDHRVVDGYDAAQFIQRVKALLQHPAKLFMD